MSLSCSDRYHFQIKLHVICVILTAFHVLVNHKIKEEVVLNVQPFQKRLGAVCSQVLVFGKQVITLFIFMFKKCLSSTTASVHQYRIGRLQYVCWHLSIL